MISFKEHIETLDEAYVNLLPHHEAEKHKHADEVFKMVQKAYSKIGGVRGTGFKDPTDMVNNIHMWKMHKKDGKITAVQLYKDSPSGRKAVAGATDGSDEGKKQMAKMAGDDIIHSRSHKEISGPALHMMKKHSGIPDLSKHAIPHNEVKKHLPKDEIRKAPKGDPEVEKHPELAKHFYQRKIGNDWHTKIMLGTPGLKIK